MEGATVLRTSVGVAAFREADRERRETEIEPERAERFAHPVEAEIARIFDEHGIEWEYEPHTFALERNCDGSVHEAFTPDFFLPDLGVYVECTVMDPALSNRKRRKARKTQRLGVNVELLSRRDIERLASRWQLPGLASAIDARADLRAAVTPDRRDLGD